MADTSIEEAESGGAVRLKVGEKLIVRLRENPTTGFHWQLQEGSETILHLEETRFVEPGGGRAGEGGERLWTFRAKKGGTAALLLKLLRAWQNDESTTRRFEVSVDVREQPA